MNNQPGIVRVEPVFILLQLVASKHCSAKGCVCVQVGFGTSRFRAHLQLQQIHDSGVHIHGTGTRRKVQLGAVRLSGMTTPVSYSKHATVHLPKRVGGVST